MVAELSAHALPKDVVEDLLDRFCVRGCRDGIGQFRSIDL
jgi:hypothetical protein